MVDFIENGTDTLTLNSIYNVEELLKSRPGLVQKDVTVKGKNGKTFTRKQWVKTSDAKGTDTTSTSQNPTSGDISFEAPADGNTKKAMATLLASGKSKQDIMASAKNQGITWKENSHEGINWMRASMAIQQHMKNNASTQPSVQSDNKPTSSKDNSSIDFSLPPHGDAKKAVKDMMASGTSKEALMEAAKKQGITWKENDNAGINWMRASMAIQKHMKDGRSTQPASNTPVSTDPKKDTQDTFSQPKKADKAPKKADKTGTKELVAKLGGKAETLKAMKDNGITWTENAHSGINYMRAMMALGKALGDDPTLADKLVASKTTQDVKDTKKDLKDTKKDVKAVKKDTQDAKKDIKGLQQQINDLQDILGEINNDADQVKDTLKEDDVLKGITTGTMSDYEKKNFGDSISKASPTSLRNYRTLGMCAGDKESEEYLSNLYTKYTLAVTMGKNYTDMDADPLRNKLSGVVNKSVVGVVKTSLLNVRKKMTQGAIQQKLFEPWINPNISLTKEDKEYIKTGKRNGIPVGTAGTYLGDRRKECQKETDGKHELLHKVLEKFKQSKEYGALASEYDNLLTEFDQLTHSNLMIQEAFTDKNTKTPSQTEQLVKKVIEETLEKHQKTLKHYQQQVANYGPGGAEDYTKATGGAAEQNKNWYERATEIVNREEKTIKEIQDIVNSMSSKDIERVAEIRQQLFDSKFTDLNANLFHYKQIATQLSFQYEIKKDFVSEYPVLSKDNLDKLEIADSDSLTNLALYAGMFKPSLTKDGKSAKDAIKDKYSERQAILEAYGGIKQVTINFQYAEDNEVRCKVSKADPQKAQEIIDNIAQDWDKENHGKMKYKIKGVYEISGLAAEQAFNDIKKKNQQYAGTTAGGKDCASDMFYHGTGSMATSLILGHTGEFKLVKAKVGRMLGDGIYLADKSSKSAQYIGDAGYSRSGIKGSLMVVEASIGNTLSGRKSHAPNHDSVFVGRQHGLLNSEWCVHDPHAVIPRYLVEMEVL